MISNHHPPPSINHQSVTYSLTYYLTGTVDGLHHFSVYLMGMGAAAEEY